MSGVPQSHLDALYAETDDPWDFRQSEHERTRFEATLAALPKARFRSVLEVGCGNGELARRIAPLCDDYLGLDAVDKALETARQTVPEARFEKAFLPCRLPGGAHDLIVLSEILYFLDPAGVTDLAMQIDARWPGAHLLMVTYRGPSGNLLECEAALALFMATLDAGRRVATARLDPAFRIDTAGPVDAAQTGAAG
jgi:SAM-dependent methyltransferase